MWATRLGTTPLRVPATPGTEPGMMGSHSTGPAGAGTSTEECGR